MTKEQTYQAGILLGLLISMAIDGVISYAAYKHFHSISVGLVVWYILGRLTSVNDNTNEIKRKQS